MNGSWKKPLNADRGSAVELAVLVQPTHGEPPQKRKPRAVFYAIMTQVGGNTAVWSSSIVVVVYYFTYEFSLNSYRKRTSGS